MNFHANHCVMQIVLSEQI